MQNESKKALEKIEYFTLIAHISSYASSEEGRKATLALLPFTDEKCARRAALPKKALLSLLEKENFSLPAWQPVGKSVSLLEEKRTLSADEMLSLLIFTDAAIKWKTSILREIENMNESAKRAEEYVALKKEADGIYDFAEERHLLRSLINYDGSIVETPLLKEIRQKKREKLKARDEVFRKYTKDTRLSKDLSLNEAVLKGERRLLALKTAAKNKIQGVVHSFSETGSTVFVEPLEAIRLTNEIATFRNKEENEIRRILRDASASLFQSSSRFAFSLAILTKLDSSFAAAKWAKKNSAHFATSSSEFALKGARHPLLENPVPLDLYFPKGVRALVITGSNAGGKTLSAKTAALFAALHASALPVTAEESRIPFFSSFFVDLGDEQSLQNSLSTFSARIKNLSEILEKADENSLILMDECESGTSPSESAALSISILDELLERGAHILVTTHLDELKKYAYEKKEAENACVEFDEKTGRPTFVLRVGIAGESHAIELAARSSFPPKVIENAKRRLDSSSRGASALISSLEEKLNEAERKLILIACREEEIARKEKRLAEKERSLKAALKEKEEKKLTEADEFLTRARKDVAKTVRLLREGELSLEKTKGAAVLLSSLTDELKEKKAKFENQKVNSKEPEETKAPEKKKKRMKNALALLYAKPLSSRESTKERDELFPGDQIVYKMNGMSGKVVQKVKKDEYIVTVGSMTFHAKRSALSLAEEGEASRAFYSVELSECAGGSRAKSELKLIGMRAKEAAVLIERQINLAILHNLPSFSIVHGKGDGILQQLVSDILTHSMAVESFSFAPPEDGGTGKTYVHMHSS